MRQRKTLGQTTVDGTMVASSKTVERIGQAISSVWWTGEVYPQVVYMHVVTHLKGRFLTVASCVNLLKKLSRGQSSESYKCLNLLVALCAEPWDVPLAIGSHGVCYHGNMGEKPASHAARKRLRESNRRSVSLKSRGLF